MNACIQIENWIREVDAIEYNGRPDCIMRMGILVEDILRELTQQNTKMSGDLLELKNCCWTLHERFFLDTEEQLRWTFYHGRFRIKRSLNALFETQKRREQVHVTIQ